MRKEGDDAELVLFDVDDTSVVVVILGISPALPSAAAPAVPASSRSSALVATPALLEEPNDTHVEASSSPLPSLSVRSSSGSKVCALL